MATSKRTASPTRAGVGKRTSSPQGKPPSRSRLSGSVFTLSALLMVGAERVIIDEVENDNAHFMAEYIDPA